MKYYVVNAYLCNALLLFSDIYIMGDMVHAELHWQPQQDAFLKHLIPSVMFSCLPQDSLLASPIILDLVILTELCQRVTVRPQGEEEFQSFHSVLALLAFLCKAPLVPPGTPVVNAFFRQRTCIENIMRYKDCMDAVSLKNFKAAVVLIGEVL